jgi:hypothetical protein
MELNLVATAHEMKLDGQLKQLMLVAFDSSNWPLGQAHWPLKGFWPEEQLTQ